MADELNVEDYHNAAGGDHTSPQWYNWSDKPHRLVYDLCAEIRQLREQKEQLITAIRSAYKGEDKGWEQLEKLLPGLDPDERYF